MKPLQKKLSQFTAPQEARSKGVYPYFTPISSAQNTEVMIEGKKVLMLGSNSYLGLTNHPKIKEAAIEAIRKYGSGCAGSPFLNGTLDIHIQLQDELAEFLHKDGVMLFSAGFLANSGVLPCVIGRNDYLIFDDRDHASIMEGKMLTFGKAIKYKHNNMEDLERVLKGIPEDACKLVVTDGVFSMEGDTANIPELVRLCDKYQATLHVDEAHGLGVFGSEGRGTCEHFGMLDKVEMVMGTFSKSLASVGGFIAADADTINYMKHAVRPYIFTASISPASTASVLAALHIMRSEPERQAALWDIQRYAYNSFKQLGFEIGNTSTPIIPIYVRDNDKTFLATRMLLDEGVFISPVVAPAVHSDETLIRVALMATHTKEQIDFGIDKIYSTFKKLEIL